VTSSKRHETGILYVLHGPSTGGANRSLSILLAGLDRTRFRPVALLPRDGPFVSRLRELDVPAHVFTLPSLARRSASVLGRSKGRVQDAWNLIRLRKLLKEEGIRLVHTNTIFPLGGAVVAKASSLPHVWHLREGLDTPEYDLRFGRAASRRIIGVLSDRMICISDYVRRVSVPDGGRDRAVVIHNALEEVPRAHVRGSPAAPVLGLVGPLGSLKRTPLFVEAAAAIARVFPKARFLVAGRTSAGNEAIVARCRERAIELGLEGCIEWIGFVDDMEAVYARIDLLLHPGVHEGFGRVLIEAMSRGIPVVSVNSGAVAEVVEDGVTGRVVPPDDPPRFAEAAIACLSDADVYDSLARAARTRTLERFQAATHVRRVTEVYNDLLGSPAP
jgi:glycosyltransferase involved in cell wall biosynthesis